MARTVLAQVSDGLGGFVFDEDSERYLAAHWNGKHLIFDSDVRAADKPCFSSSELVPRQIFGRCVFRRSLGGLFALFAEQTREENGFFFPDWNGPCWLIFGGCAFPLFSPSVVVRVWSLGICTWILASDSACRRSGIFWHFSEVLSDGQLTKSDRLPVLTHSIWKARVGNRGHGKPGSGPGNL
jgi:hypothetical protein